MNAPPLRAVSLADPGAGLFTELERQLTGPQGASHRAAALAQLQQRVTVLRAAALGGLPPAQYQRTERLHAMLEAARQVLDALPVAETDRKGPPFAILPPPPNPTPGLTQ